MLKSSMGTVLAGSYAVVTYIPDPLGEFLDRLRLELAPDCNPHAHVTLMPPRVLPGSGDRAWAQIWTAIHNMEAFEVEATGVCVFPGTNVVYVDLGAGRETLIRVHAELNRDSLLFPEPYPYHPHITLAQEIPAGRFDQVVEGAHRAWSAYNHRRTFTVDRFTFVRNDGGTSWTDLASVDLRQPGG